MSEIQRKQGIKDIWVKQVRRKKKNQEYVKKKRKQRYMQYEEKE